MCGIAGFWQAKRGEEHPLETLKRMGSAIVHRGPDDSGEFHDADAGVGFAFRRLAILDLTPEGHQPMTSASGRYVMEFNGEVYNFEEIRKELAGVRWRGHSDTEVMLAAFERWGVETAVRRFVGMFAFALWDCQERTLSLVRDRLGIKPVYYGRVGADFVFASELKAIWQYPGFEGQIDREALALYLRHNCVPSPWCVYQGLRKLPPGHILMLRGATEEPELRRFWSAREVALRGTNAPFSGPDSEAVDLLEQKLKTAVGLRMIADVPLGAFLSGGIDSSMVVALMQAQSSRPVKTFTIGFHESAYNEATYAKRVAEHLGTEHTELYLTAKDALDVVPLLPRMYDEPFSDSSQIPTYLVSKLARGVVTVSLSGDGGDELFAGYNRYLLVRQAWNRIRPAPRFARKGIARALQALPVAGIEAGFRSLYPVLPKAMRIANPRDKVEKFAAMLRAGSPEEIYRQACSHWENPSEIVASVREPDAFLRLLQEASSLPSLEEAMMLIDQLTYLPDDILTKVDRASMAVSLEARVPLLDHHVVEFAWSLPLRLKIRDGIGKWALRQVLYKYVPPALMERPKMGFSIPIGDWLRGPLREWAEELLAEKNLSSQGLLHAAMIRSKWEQHLSGKRNWQYLLWDVLIFQDWFLHVGRRSLEPALD